MSIRREFTISPFMRSSVGSTSAGSAVCASTSNDVCGGGGDCGGGGSGEPALLLDGSTTMLGAIKVGANDILGVNSENFDLITPPSAPPVGGLKLYANQNDNVLHYIDANGVDKPVAESDVGIPNTYGELQSYTPTPYSISGTSQGFSHLEAGNTNNITLLNTDPNSAPQGFKIIEGGVYRVSIFINQNKLSPGGGDRNITFTAFKNLDQIPFVSGTSETNPSNIGGTVLTDFVADDEFKVEFSTTDSSYSVEFLDVNINLQRIANRIPGENPFNQELNIDSNVSFNSLSLPKKNPTFITTANNGYEKLYIDENDNLLKIKDDVSGKPSFVIDNGVEYGDNQEVNIKNHTIDNVRDLKSTKMTTTNFTASALKYSDFVVLLKDDISTPFYPGSPTVIGATRDLDNKLIVMPDTSSLIYSLSGLTANKNALFLDCNYDVSKFKPEVGTLEVIYGNLKVKFEITITPEQVPIYNLSLIQGSNVLGSVILDEPLYQLRTEGNFNIDFEVFANGSTSPLITSSITNPSSNGFNIVKTGAGIFNISSILLADDIALNSSQIFLNEDGAAISSGGGTVICDKDKLDITGNLQYENKPWPWAIGPDIYTYKYTNVDVLSLSAGELSFNNIPEFATFLYINNITQRGEVLTDLIDRLVEGYNISITDTDERSYVYSIQGVPGYVGGGTTIIQVRIQFEYKTSTDITIDNFVSFQTISSASGNPFNQDLNTTDAPTFETLLLTNQTNDPPSTSTGGRLFCKTDDDYLHMTNPSTNDTLIYGTWGCSGNEFYYKYLTSFSINPMAFGSCAPNDPNPVNTTEFKLNRFSSRGVDCGWENNYKVGDYISFTNTDQAGVEYIITDPITVNGNDRFIKVQFVKSTGTLNQNDIITVSVAKGAESTGNLVSYYTCFSPNNGIAANQQTGVLSILGGSGSFLFNEIGLIAETYQSGPNNNSIRFKNFIPGDYAYSIQCPLTHNLNGEIREAQFKIILNNTLQINYSEFIRFEGVVQANTSLPYTYLLKTSGIIQISSENDLFNAVIQDLGTGGVGGFGVGLGAVAENPPTKISFSYLGQTGSTFTNNYQVSNSLLSNIQNQITTLGDTQTNFSTVSTSLSDLLTDFNTFKQNDLIAELIDNVNDLQSFTAINTNISLLTNQLAQLQNIVDTLTNP